MGTSSDLTIRQFERTDLVLDAVIEVDADHGQQVRFATSSTTAIDASTIPVVVADVGSGGIGAKSGVYMPLNCRGTIKVLDPERPDAATSKELNPEHILFEHQIKVRRCEMISGAPLFHLGMSFQNVGTGTAQAVQQLLQLQQAAVRESRREDHGAGEGGGHHA